MSDIKTRENLLRRKADRQGLRLSKSRRRDTRALDYGLYAIFDIRTGGTIHPALANYFVYCLTLDQVEEWLSD